MNPNKKLIQQPNKLVKQHDILLNDKSLNRKITSAKTTINSSNNTYEKKLEKRKQEQRQKRNPGSLHCVNVKQNSNKNINIDQMQKIMELYGEGDQRINLKTKDNITQNSNNSNPINQFFPNIESLLNFKTQGDEDSQKNQLLEEEIKKWWYQEIKDNQDQRPFTTIDDVKPNNIAINAPKNKSYNVQNTKIKQQIINNDSNNKIINKDENNNIKNEKIYSNKILKEEQKYEMEFDQYDEDSQLDYQISDKQQIGSNQDIEVEIKQDDEINEEEEEIQDEFQFSILNQSEIKLKNNNYSQICNLGSPVININKKQ